MQMKYFNVCKEWEEVGNTGVGYIELANIQDFFFYQLQFISKYSVYYKKANYLKFSSKQSL